MSFNLSRRGLLIGAAAGGGLLVAWSLTEPRFGAPLEPGHDEVAFDAWIKVSTDGIVTIAVPQLEMGQGVSTILPQVIATEMGADWRMVAVEPAPISGAYANVPLAAKWAPMWMPFAAGIADDAQGFLPRRYARSTQFNATADGTSLAAYENSCRAAAANVRALLAMAAADNWDVDWEECEVTDGHVRHGGKVMAFGQLARDAAEYDPPSSPPLKPEAAAERPVAHGQANEILVPRLDLPSKVDGSHLFAGDVRLPDLAFASIRHGQIGKSELADLDEPAVKGLRGYVGMVRHAHWVAAVGRKLVDG